MRGFDYGVSCCVNDTQFLSKMRMGGPTGFRGGIVVVGRLMGDGLHIQGGAGGG